MRRKDARDERVGRAQLTSSSSLLAWSLTYLFLHGKKALVSRRPAPILLSSAMAANAVLYGVEYFVNS